MTTEREKIIGAAWTLGEALVAAVTKIPEAVAEKVAEPDHSTAGPFTETPKVNQWNSVGYMDIVEKAVAGALPAATQTEHHRIMLHIVAALQDRGVLK